MIGTNNGEENQLEVSEAEYEELHNEEKFEGTVNENDRTDKVEKYQQIFKNMSGLINKPNK